MARASIVAPQSESTFAVALRRFARASALRVALITALAIAIVAAPPSPAPSAYAADGAIAGNVTIAGGGAALDGCVTVYSSSWAYVGDACVDGAGHYSIAAVPEGQYYLLFSTFTGGAQVYYNGSESSNDAALLTVTAGPTTTLNVALPPASVLSGNVTKTGGSPALNGSIYVYEIGSGDFIAAASVDGAGHYEFPRLVGGSYTVEFTGFTGAADEFYDDKAHWSDADAFVVTPGGTTILNQELLLGATISGTVSMDVGGAASGGCVGAYDSASLDYVTGTCTISGSGGYTLDGLRPGAYVVEYYSFDGAVGEWYNNKASSATANVVVLNEGTSVVANASLASAGAISGAVTLDAGGPAVNGCVTLYDDSNQYVSGRCTGEVDNTFAFEGLTPGIYHYRAYGYDSTTDEWYNNASSFATSSDIVVVAAGTTIANISLAVGPGYGGTASAAGTVLVPSGLAYADVVIDLYSVGGAYIDETVPDASGNWSFLGLNDGGYSYCVYYPNGNLDCTGFTLSGGGAVTGLDDDFSAFQWVRTTATVKTTSSQFCPTYEPISGGYTGYWNCVTPTSGTTVSANYLVEPGTYKIYAYDWTPSSGSTDFIWWRSGSPTNTLRSLASTYTGLASPSSGTIAVFDFTGKPSLGSGTATVGLTASGPVYAGEAVTLEASVGGVSGAGEGVVEFYDDADMFADRVLAGGVANAPYVFDGWTPTSTLSTYYRGDGNYGTLWSDFTPDYLPTVTTVTPQYGSPAGGQVVGIEGTALGTVTQVTFDGVPATSLTLLNQWYIEVTTPPGTSPSAEVVVTNAVGASPPEVSGFFAYLDTSVVSASPVRILDTAGFTPGVVRCYPVVGLADVPAGAVAVMLNVTTVGPTGNGYVVVYPDTFGDGTTFAPLSSTVNFEIGRDVANSAIVALPSNGDICAYSAGGTLARLVFDVAGYIVPGSGLTIQAAERLLDTRQVAQQVTGPVAPSTVYDVQVTGNAGVPTGATAVLANVTVVGATAPGHLRMWEQGTTVPNTSVVNYAPGQTKANGQIIALSPSGELSFESFTGPGTATNPVQVIIDVVGYVDTGSLYQATAPTRIVETRASEGVVGPIPGPLVPNTVYPVTLSDTALIPSDATAVVLNVTAVGPTAFGNLRVYPDTNGLGTTTPPNASVINYIPGRAIPNMVIVQIPPDRMIDFYNNMGLTADRTDLVVDVIGYIAAAP